MLLPSAFYLCFEQEHNAAVTRTFAEESDTVWGSDAEPLRAGHFDDHGQHHTSRNLVCTFHQLEVHRQLLLNGEGTRRRRRSGELVDSARHAGLNQQYRERGWRVTQKTHNSQAAEALAAVSQEAAAGPKPQQDKKNSNSIFFPFPSKDGAKKVD